MRKRVDVDVKDVDVEKLAKDYIALKAEEKTITSQTKAINTKLKEYLTDKPDNFIDTEDGTVSLTYREKTVFDEENLIELLKNTPGCSGIVKTKEYIDFDELDSALYNGRIQASSIAPYSSTVKTAVLNIKKARKK